MSVTTDSTVDRSSEQRSSGTDTVRVVHDRRPPWLAIGVTAVVVGTISVAGTWAATTARTSPPQQATAATSHATGPWTDGYGTGSSTYQEQVPATRAGLGQAVENSYAHPTTVVTHQLPSPTQNLPGNLRRQVAPE